MLNVTRIIPLAGISTLAGSLRGPSVTQLQPLASDLQVLSGSLVGPAFTGLKPLTNDPRVFVFVEASFCLAPSPQALATELSPQNAALPRRVTAAYPVMMGILPSPEGRDAALQLSLRGSWSPQLERSSLAARLSPSALLPQVERSSLAARLSPSALLPQVERSSLAARLSPSALRPQVLSIVPALSLYSNRRDHLVVFSINEPPTELYNVEFLVANIVRQLHSVSFNVAAGSYHEVIFAVRTDPREKVIYDQVSFNIIDSNVVTAVDYAVSYNVAEPDGRYDVSFAIIAPPVAVEVVFNVVESERLIYEVGLTVIGEWLPVTLPVDVSPAFPGNIPPSANKHRLNVRVTAEDVLVGAGFAVFQWRGANTAGLRITVRDIPDIGADEIRVIIYDSGKKIIDLVTPYAPIWLGEYSGEV